MLDTMVFFGDPFGPSENLKPVTVNRDPSPEPNYPPTTASPTPERATNADTEIRIAPINAATSSASISTSMSVCNPDAHRRSKRNSCKPSRLHATPGDKVLIGFLGGWNNPEVESTAGVVPLGLVPSDHEEPEPEAKVGKRKAVAVAKGEEEVAVVGEEAAVRGGRGYGRLRKGMTGVGEGGAAISPTTTSSALSSQMTATIQDHAQVARSALKIASDGGTGPGKDARRASGYRDFDRTRPTIDTSTAIRTDSRVESLSGNAKTVGTSAAAIQPRQPPTAQPQQRHQFGKNGGVQVQGDTSCARQGGLKRNEQTSPGSDQESIVTSPSLPPSAIKQGSPQQKLPAMQNSPMQTSKPPTGHQSLPSLQSQGLPTARLSYANHTNPHSPAKDYGHSRAAHCPPLHGRTAMVHYPTFPATPGTEPSPSSTTHSGRSPGEPFSANGQNIRGLSPPSKFGPLQFGGVAGGSNGFVPQPDVQTPISASTQISVMTSESSPIHERNSAAGLGGNGSGNGSGNGNTSRMSGGDASKIGRVSHQQQQQQHQLHEPNGPATAGGFKCTDPDCNVPPFQTQYLLNSHANVHSQDRPHYCSVKTCKRSEGGKGFKRKNEMIRHGLVHQSPGYICPFCPEREHKYPRPDNLQRHVRAHHTDKSQNDPELRRVLSQRPEGGTRSRRRRVNS